MPAPKILVLDRSETLAEQLRVALADLTPKPEIVPCSRVGSVAARGSLESGWLESDDRFANFKRAFGEDWQAFDTALSAHVAALRPF